MVELVIGAVLVAVAVSYVLRPIFRPPAAPGERTCAACGGRAQADAAYCPQCGEPLGPGPDHCPQCGAPLETDARFCARCGAVVGD